MQPAELMITSPPVAAFQPDAPPMPAPQPPAQAVAPAPAAPPQLQPVVQDPAANLQFAPTPTATPPAAHAPAQVPAQFAPVAQPVQQQAAPVAQTPQAAPQAPVAMQAPPQVQPQPAAVPFQPAQQQVAPVAPAIAEPVQTQAPAVVPTPKQAPPPVASGATAMQLAGKRLRIGEVLMDMGLIDQGQLERALHVQRESGQRLGKVLISENIVSAIDIARALARRLDIDYIDVNEVQIDSSVMALVPFALCSRYDCVAIGQDKNTILLAMADPTNVFAIDDIRLATGQDIRVVVGSPDAIDIALSKLINLDESVSQAVSGADDWDDDRMPLEDIKDSDADAPAIRLVNQIITQAVVTGASDLHFEPTSEDMTVRFRQDGVLSHVTTVPNKLRPGVTSRIKIMANMDISERRRPQDGRIGLLVGERPIDLRVAILPTVYGEKVVMRVLDRSNVLMTMDMLGFLPAQLDKLRQVYTQPYGCLLVTGPTGSGKSTTLYAALNEVNDIAKNIITVEDPVEYRLSGINQVQVNNKAGLTFASSLRSILRCDPDIVMIGEMRDVETAKIGIEAALTGHLVLSTLHTNDAPGALPRLIEMGIEPFLVSSSILGVLAQRLARRLCKCKEEYVPTRDDLVKQGFPQEIIESDAQIVLQRAVGCHRCGQSGYKGRLGVHEVMMMNEEIEALTIQHASAEEIGRAAVRNGMITLFNDGVQKILRGDTTMEELHRIVQS
jgi:type IV pilus assembly protein PilB